jgi:hypothetical protein
MGFKPFVKFRLKGRKDFIRFTGPVEFESKTQARQKAREKLDEFLKLPVAEFAEFKKGTIFIKNK